MSYFCDSHMYIRSKYSLHICFSWSSLALSRSLGCPHLSSMTFLLSAAFLSCSFLSSSAAFFLRSSLSFFFLSGVMNPFFAFFAGSLSLKPGPDLGLLSVDFCLLLIVTHG